ncbi:MAG: glycoside hydrolase family 99-like domain-containing protein [Firmicutes bacterium]|nr:glycoside hydrolase family 99-like domain-containing protein [Candidatus Colivicinus equi]
MKEKINYIIIWLKVTMSGMFDKDFYLNSYKDVKDDGIPPLRHFILYGAKEGRNPSNDFDVAYYLNNNLDVKESGMNPLYHYIKYGKKEGRKTKESLIKKEAKSFINFNCNKAVLIFDHCSGGGTTKYLFNNIINPSSEIQNTILVHYDRVDKVFVAQIRQKTSVVEETTYDKWELFTKDIGRFRYSRIIVDSLVYWPSVQKALEWITEYKNANNKTIIEYKGHDYYCICPSYTLQDNAHKYCGIRCDETECNSCVRTQGNHHVFLDGDSCEYFSISHWRKMWGTFFNKTVDVLEVFSPSSKEIFLKAYPKALPKIKLNPHKTKSFDCCNVAVLGYLVVHKGSEVIKTLCKYLDDNQIDDMHLFLIGSNPTNICSPHLKETGEYERNELPQKLKDANIDVVFIPSTWPETFCYTAGESIALGYPTACFDLGGQADQVRVSENGIILDDYSPDYLYDTFKKFKGNFVLTKGKQANKKTVTTKTVVMQDNKSRDFLKWIYQLRDDKKHFVPETENNIKTTRSMPKIIATYLPQFHDFSENIEWFGRGFSEWTNTSQTVPQFIGHRQPHVPIDVGYYNLNTSNTMYRQIELAKKYGIYGFSIYYYWFSGVKLMDHPLKMLLQDPKLDFPFFLFWANVDWTKEWGDGANRETLYKSEIHPEEAEKFMEDVLPYMKDSRYIRINNKPVLLIYKLNMTKKEDYDAFVKNIQSIARREGFEGLYLLSPIEDYMDHENLEEVEKHYMLDALIEFHPVAGRTGWMTKKEQFMDPSCRSICYDVDDFVSNKKYLLNTKAKVFPGLFPDWDNSPRRYNRGAWILQNTPDNYKEWLLDLVKWVRKHNQPEERFIFVNAWNEWAEGAHLEPDSYYGYAYLQKTREALEETKGVK